jgi:hypothetical protein
MSRLGFDRPVSRKLRCRADTSAWMPRSSWVSRRRCRQSRSSAPNAVPVVVAAVMAGTLAATVGLIDDVAGNGPAATTAAVSPRDRIPQAGTAVRASSASRLATSARTSGIS